LAVFTKTTSALLYVILNVKSNFTGNTTKREVNLYSFFVKHRLVVARLGQITDSEKLILQVMGRKKGAQHLHIFFQNFQCTLQIH